MVISQRVRISILSDNVNNKISLISMQLYCNSFNEHFIIIFSMCFWPCFISEILDGIIM